jgi:hypothetical protein
MEKIKLLWERIKATPLDKIIGYILLAPPIFSVLMFFAYPPKFNKNERYNSYRSVWTGNSQSPSALPFYLGLMAMTGAYLIKDKK